MEGGEISTDSSKHIFGECSLIKEINLTFGHDTVFDGYFYDSVYNGHRSITFDFTDHGLPRKLDLPDLIICLAEELRFQMNKQNKSTASQEVGSEYTRLFRK